MSLRVGYRVTQLDSPTSRVELEFDWSSLESSFEQVLTESSRVARELSRFMYTPDFFPRIVSNLVKLYPLRAHNSSISL